MNTHPQLPLPGTFRMMSGPDEQGLFTILDSAGKCFHSADAEGTQPAYDDRFDDVGAFFFGFSVAKLEGAYFYITTDGRRAYPEEFAGTVGAFDSTGRALVCTTAERFYLVANAPGGPICKKPYEDNAVDSDVADNKTVEDAETVTVGGS